jgi:L-ascorbate metabolism protein UlaG (beta-lactamase superfamily)
MTHDMKNHHFKNKFRNPGVSHRTGFFSQWHLAVDAYNVTRRIRIRKRERHLVRPVVPKIDKIRNPQHPIQITWIGHASMLIQIHGINILTDPIFSKRVSWIYWGPRRFQRPGIPREYLPNIDYVLLSHDHYDHLDKPSIQYLQKTHDPVFIAPLKVGALLMKMGARKVTELDWWQKYSNKDFLIHCTPVQHNAGRTFWDSDKRLWGGFIIQSKGKQVYFAGDSGYFSGFSEIKNRFGVSDVHILPIGAYKPRRLFRSVHMDPVDAVRAYGDLGGTGYFVPMHWGIRFHQ